MTSPGLETRVMPLGGPLNGSQRDLLLVLNNLVNALARGVASGRMTIDRGATVHLNIARAFYAREQALQGSILGTENNWREEERRYLAVAMETLVAMPGDELEELMAGSLATSQFQFSRRDDG